MSAVPPVGARIAFAFPAHFRAGWAESERRATGVVVMHGIGTFAVEPDALERRPLGRVWLGVDATFVRLSTESTAEDRANAFSLLRAATARRILLS